MPSPKVSHPLAVALCVGGALAAAACSSFKNGSSPGEGADSGGNDAAGIDGAGGGDTATNGDGKVSGDGSLDGGGTSDACASPPCSSTCDGASCGQGDGS